jgi:hypothetical protein
MRKLIYLTVYLLIANVCIAQNSVHIPDKAIRSVKQTKNIKANDTIKVDTFALDLTKMPKPALVVKVLEQDSIIRDNISTVNAKNTVIDSLKTQIKTLPKPAGSNPIDYIVYFIALIGILLLFGLSFVKKFQNSKIPLIQRLVADTTPFWKGVMKIAGFISVIIPTILSIGIVNSYTFSVLGTIEIVTLAITGMSLFTKKDTIIAESKEEKTQIEQIEENK